MIDTRVWVKKVLLKVSNLVSFFVTFQKFGGRYII